MWTTAFALPHTTFQRVVTRQQSRSDAHGECDLGMSSRSHQQHHDIVFVSSECAQNSNRRLSSKNSVSFLYCVRWHALTLSSRDSIARF